MADIFDSIQPDTKDIFDTISPETKPIPDVYGGQYGEDISKSFGGVDISRFGKQLYNVMVAIPAHELGKVEMDTADVRAYELTKQYEQEKGIKLQDDLFSQQVNEWSVQLRLPPEQRESSYLKNEPQFKSKEDINPFAIAVSEAEGIKDKAIDVIAGIVGFAAQIAVLKRAFPMASETTIWEVQNLATGGKPGQGVMNFTAMSAAGKLVPYKVSPVTQQPFRTVGRELGKAGVEGAAFAGMSAVEGGSAEDIVTSGFIPLVFRVPGFMRSLGAKNSKLVETISTQPDFLSVPGGTTQVRPGRNNWQTKWGGGNKVNLKRKMIDLLGQAEKIEQANPINKDGLLNNLADQMTAIDKQLTSMENMSGKSLQELHQIAKKNGVEVPKGTTKTGIIRLLEGNQDIIEVDGGFQVRNLSGDVGWESKSYKTYEEAQEALAGQELGITQPKGGLNDALATATETLSLAPKGETQGWLGKLRARILGQSKSIAKASKDFGVEPEYIIGNIQLQEVGRKIVSRFPQKIVDQNSLDRVGNAIAQKLGMGGWGIKFKLVNKLPKNALGLAVLDDPTDLTQRPRGGTIYIKKVDGHLFGKYEWEPKPTQAGQVGRKHGEASRYTQAWAKRAIIHELGHFVEPGRYAASNRVLVHTPEFEQYVNDNVKLLFVERPGKKVPVSEVPVRAEYPPGTNVYRTSSGRIVTEVPGGKKEQQTTEMKNGRVYEKSTGEELTIDTELSPGGIDRLSIAPEEKPVGRKKPKRRPKPGAKVKREKKVQEKSAVDIFREWKPKAVKISKTVWEKTKRETLARKAASAVRYIKWLEGRGVPHDEAVRMSKAKLKGKVRRPEFEPPQMSDAQWLGLSERAEYVYKNDYFKQLDVQEALDKLRWEGRIPTPGEFISLEPILGRDTINRMFAALVETKRYGWSDVPRLVRDGFKSKFAYDPQTARQLMASAVRHPVDYTHAVWTNLKTYVSKEAAKKVTVQLENNPYFQMADEYGVNMLAVNPWAKADVHRLEQFGEFSHFLSTRKNRVAKAWGKLIEASERGANLGIDEFLTRQIESAEKKVNILKDKGWNEEQIAKFRKDRGNAINALAKRIVAKNPRLRQIQSAANWVLFSPSWTVARPMQTFLSVKNLLKSPGNRTYVLQHTLAQIAALSGISTLISTIAHKRRLQNPTEEPSFDSSSDISDSLWGKIRWGNDVIDFSGGDASWYRLLSRVVTSAYVAAKELQTGQQITKFGGKPVPAAGEELWKYAQSRETIWLGLSKTLATGKDWMGKPLDDDFGRTKELLKAFPMEPLVSLIEAGNADGMWEAFLQKDIKEGSKEFVKNMPIGFVGLFGGGTTTYPVSPNATRADYRNIIAQNIYKKNWEDLTPIEQRKLTVANREDFKVFEKQISEYRVENPYDIARIKEEEHQAGERIREKLSKENQLKVSGVSLGVNRSPGKFYLNDERFNQYQDLIAEILNERLSKFKTTPNKKVLEAVVSASKNRAEAMLRREMK